MSGMKGTKWGVRRYSPFDERSIESKLKESKEIKEKKESEELKEKKERLALDILMNAMGNEESMNKACDLIKELGLIDDYY